MKKEYEREKQRLRGLLGSELTGDYFSPVFGEGNASSYLMLIGEAPGKEEAQSGTPFVGKAGRQLNVLLDDAGITRDSIFITNAVKFRPTRISKNVANRTPTPREIKDGSPLLRMEIESVKPKIIATLGNSPLFAVSYLYSLGILKIGEVHGKVLNLSDGSILFPLYHPASVIYNRQLSEVLKRDIIELSTLIKRVR